eukprot:scaffold116329_cov20-Tisochrysis_lutea.AAC.1
MGDTVSCVFGAWRGGGRTGCLRGVATHWERLLVSKDVAACVHTWHQTPLAEESVGGSNKLRPVAIRLKVLMDFDALKEAQSGLGTAAVIVMKLVWCSGGHGGLVVMDMVVWWSWWSGGHVSLFGIGVDGRRVYLETSVCQPSRGPGRHLWVRFLLLNPVKVWRVFHLLNPVEVWRVQSSALCLDRVRQVAVSSCCFESGLSYGGCNQSSALSLDRVGQVAGLTQGFCIEVATRALRSVLTALGRSAGWLNKIIHPDPNQAP